MKKVRSGTVASAIGKAIYRPSIGRSEVIKIVLFASGKKKLYANIPISRAIMIKRRVFIGKHTFPKKIKDTKAMTIKVTD